MKTASAIKLFQYWNRQRGQERAARREAIEPSDIRDVLGDMIILEADAVDDEFRFRLVGSRVATAFGEDVRTSRFKSLFAERSHPLLGRLLRNCSDSFLAVQIGFTAITARGRAADHEILLLPLLGKRDGKRILGIVAPVESPYWLGFEPFVKTEIKSVRTIDADREPLFLANRPEVDLTPALVPEVPALEMEDGQRIKGPRLMVIDGGRTD